MYFKEISLNEDINKLIFDYKFLWKMLKILKFYPIVTLNFL